MSKIPVQKTVVRNGKVHSQTYWEGTDAQRPGSAALSGLRPTLAPADDDPVAALWEQQAPDAPHRDACTAAGITPAAAREMTLTYREDDLTERVYAEGLDQMPRPRAGWGVVMNNDCRRYWGIAINDSGGKLTWEDAVAWSDAGFTFPWSRTVHMIEDGVSIERAVLWRDALGLGPNDDRIGNYAAEMLAEDLTLEEAVEWRLAMTGGSHSRHPLTRGQLAYREQGFTPKKAYAWMGVLTSETSAAEAAELQRLKWSPTSIKKFIAAATRNTGARYYAMQYATVRALIGATEAVGGPQRAIAWAGIVERTWDRGYADPDAVRAVREADAWIQHVKDETGVELLEDAYPGIASMLPRERDTLVELAKAVRHFTGPDDQSRYIDFARRVGSPENLRFLQESGFPLQPDMPHITVMGAVKPFDAAAATPQERDGWLRHMAADLYWRSGGRRDGGRPSFLPAADKNQIAADAEIDPMALKDALLASGGKIDRVQLEGIVKGGISTAVSDGWI